MPYLDGLYSCMNGVAWMRIYKTDSNIPKGWYTGPWDSELTVSIGFANEGVNEPHLHQRMTEIYFMAQGTVEMRIDETTVTLSAKEVIVVEPGEAHTFLSSSPDHFHFVIQTPGLSGAQAKADKILVPLSCLGL